MSSCCIFSTPANMLSHNNQDRQYGPHGLQYAGCNLLILEMTINVPHGMQWSMHNCLVDVVRKCTNFWFSCLCNHYMMQLLPLLNILVAGALTPLWLIWRPHVIMIFLLCQSLLSVNDEQQLWLLKLPKSHECSSPPILIPHTAYLWTVHKWNNVNLSFQMVATSCTSRWT